MKYIPHIVAIVFLFLYINSFSNRQGDKTKIKALSAVNDTLRSSVDKQGRTIANISVIESSRAFFKRQVQSKDSLITKLQKQVNRKTQTATIVQTVTRDTGSTKTVVLPGEIVVKDSVMYHYPIYKSNWSEKWSSGFILAGPDSTKRDIHYNSELTIWHELKGRKLRVFAREENPLSSVTGLRSYCVKLKPKRFVVSAGIGAGVNIQGQIKPVLSIHAGVKILEF